MSCGGGDQRVPGDYSPRIGVASANVLRLQVRIIIQNGPLGNALGPNYSTRL